MNFFSKKWRVVLIAAAVIAAAGFAADHFIGFNPISTAVNFVASPVQSGFSYIAHAMEDARDFIWDMRAYKADNKKLESENIELKRANRDSASYREENERLRELLDLKTSMDGSYTTVAAQVIAYSGDNRCERMEINKGTLSRIAVGNAVITPDGIAGKVTETGPDYAVVTTILDSSSAIGIKVSRTGGSGLVEGDEELSKDVWCKLSFMDKNTPIIVGDIVETSGTGGVYPAGLVVGSVMSVSADSTGALNYAVINPAAEIDKLREVLVINGTK